MDTRALELLLPDGLSARAFADALAGEVEVVTGRAETIDRVLWDTFDGRLRGAGLELVENAGRLELVEAATGRERAGTNLEPGAEPLLASDLPAGPLHDRLRPVIEMRAVAPIARVRSRRLALDVLDELGKIVARARLEEPTCVAGERRIALHARLHLHGVRGYDSELDELRVRLGELLGLRDAPLTVADDAVEATGGSAGGRSSKLRVELDPAGRADAAAAAILRRLLEVIEQNLPGTLADTDSEFLHDLRVAVRRTRALQRELRGVFDPQPLAAFRDAFKELQRVTGPTRDLDVQLLEFDEQVAGLPLGSADDAAPLRRLLEDHLVVQRRRMVGTLGSQRTRALLDDWSRLIDGLSDPGGAGGPDAGRPVAELASRRIAAVHRRMVEMGVRVDDGSPAEALHDLRKKGKELRYLLEFFSSLYPPDIIKPMVSKLKGLQDVLGTFQDREVQAGLLRSLADEVATLRGGPAALMAMGALVARLEEEQAQARERFAERFDAFAAGSQRKLVEQTFG